jgi:hypothetical protein
MISVLLLVSLVACQRPEPVAEPPSEAAPLAMTADGPLRIIKLYPDRAVVGRPFNVQPNGQSALAVGVANATRTTRIVINGKALPTTFGKDVLTAYVPRELFAAPATLEVRLADGDRVSEPATLTVAAAQ